MVSSLVKQLAPGSTPPPHQETPFEAILCSALTAAESQTVRRLLLAYQARPTNRSSGRFPHRRCELCWAHNALVTHHPRVQEGRANAALTWKGRARNRS